MVQNNHVLCTVVGVMIELLIEIPERKDGPWMFIISYQTRFVAFLFTTLSQSSSVLFLNSRVLIQHLIVM